MADTRHPIDRAADDLATWRGIDRTEARRLLARALASATISPLAVTVELRGGELVCVATTELRVDG